ncbi:Junctional adhesion molecule-like [Dissostichus eleginoides]|uniref:Junctional adhesion molecule-like n=1 Tax=Dissostichus eleginoides TaxID=100907 RepID=A0AAD9F9F4_DISEL|nr:Junctional adhesion molecule-like [Dissostichus eleginoides]
MATLTSAQHVFMFLWIIGSVAAGDLKAKPGKDVTLPCNNPTGSAVTKLVWSRPGLKDKYVFFFRDNRSYETNQDPRYHGRVELKGVASVVLKNVDIDDSGTYECEVTISSISLPVQSINLTVSKEDSEDSVEVRANAGENVTLQCNSSTDAAITKIKWDRPDLKGLSVFFFRDNKLHEIYQNLRYRGRVERKDPEMKNGNASVLLKNVTVNDTGMYQCWVTTPNMPGKLLRSVHLIVSERPPKVPSSKVGLGVALGLVCPLVGVAGFAFGRHVGLKSKSGPL